MYLNRVDCLFETLKAVVKHAAGANAELSVEDYDKLYNAAKGSTIQEISDQLNKMDGFRALRKDDDSLITADFLAGDKWFAEGVQSDRSAGLLFNSETKESACLLFYDKECDFYIVDYIDITSVPPTAVVRDVCESLTVCITERIDLADKYNNCLLLQV